ncbi:trypsin-like peptidase domain-containing protein [uncultured Mameliella sp.]|uniref:trypsin-like peptidase domain-containing protein n=1 Tax=uncultured Mameliella sp. TaxID=1447087 RepID=UPI00260B0221|nr:trypsin-like peptidase domain-containing protein [uncultured Mameliella sp.]
MIRPFALVFSLLCAAPVSAQPVEFDPADFGKVILAPKQSAGGGGLTFEQAFGDYQNEPILTYGENSLPRRLGRPVGRLDVLYDNGKTGVCTAFIVDAQYILTNNHCIPGVGGIGVEAAQFVAGFVDGAQARGAEKFQVSTAPVETSVTLDYSVLRVFGDPSARFGKVELAAEAPEDAELLWIIGHPQGQAQHISREGCAADDPAVSPQGKLVHSCDTLGGNSGSPVFRITDRKVVALHHAGDNRTGYNFAIPMARILAESVVLKAAAPVPKGPQVDARCEAMLEAAPDFGCAGYETFLETCEAHPLAAMVSRHAERVCELEAAEDARRLAAVPKAKAPDAPAVAKPPAEETARDDALPVEPDAPEPDDPAEEIVDLDSLSRDALEDWAKKTAREIEEVLDDTGWARADAINAKLLTEIFAEAMDGNPLAAPAREAVAPHVAKILDIHANVEAIYAARDLEDKRILARVRGDLAIIREGTEAAARESAAELLAKFQLYKTEKDRLEPLATDAKKQREAAMKALSDTLTEPDPGPLAALQLLFRERITNLIEDDVDDVNAHDITYHFLPAPEGHVAYLWCEEGNSKCQGFVQRDGFKYVGADYSSSVLVPGKGLTAAEILNDPAASKVEITEETGGPFYPMRNGKRMTWTENWDWDTDPEPEAIYHMTLLQRCCEIYATSDSGRRLVWEIEYTFETDNLDTSYTEWFDPSLGWVIRSKGKQVQKGTSKGERTRVIRKTLREILARPD